MPTSLCVFDLDGTLVDSMADIASSVNECLQLLGLPVRPVADYRYLVGDGVPTLCRRIVGETHPHLVSRLAELVRARYRTRTLLQTRPYDGVPQLVAAAGRSGRILGVLSNKPHDMTRRIVRHFWPGNAFRVVQGYVGESLKKPNPAQLIEMREAVGAPADRTWMIGDTPVDVRTAQAAGVRCLAVTWGFRPRADLESAGAEIIVDTPADAAAALGIDL